VADNLKKAALTALRLALRPLVGMLLRNGVTVQEAGEVFKQTYVEVARKDYGVHGRPTNSSRVAILTGMSRREVKRVVDALDEGEPEAIEKMNSATRVLGGWHTDADFSDGEGNPAPLDFAGDDKSFAELCRVYAADIPPTAMLKELSRVGAVVETANGSYAAAMRYYIPESQDPDAVLRAGSVLEDLGNTVTFNLDRDKDAEAPTRFEGRATNASVRASAANKFREYLEKEAQEMLERTDAWLARHEQAPESSRQERRVRLGLGLYQIGDDKKDRPDE
jgi:hypothetical protein